MVFAKAVSMQCGNKMIPKIIWQTYEVKHDDLHDNAKKIIEFICENSYVTGLTEKVEAFIEKELGKKVKAKEIVQNQEPVQEIKETEERQE